MPIITIINRKGGSGKSTVATNLAAFCAHAGIPVLLGDCDQQQSSRLWLRLRNADLPLIHGASIDARQIVKPPVGVKHVVLDTPGGLDGLDFARVVQQSDVILLPVCSSIFDRESSANCLAELRSLPRVASGRCKVGLIGMRIDPRTSIAQTWKKWADDLQVPVLGMVTTSTLYANCLESGQSVFDLPVEKTITQRYQWRPILEWLGPVLFGEDNKDAVSRSAGHEMPTTETHPLKMAPQSAPFQQTVNLQIPESPAVQASVIAAPPKRETFFSSIPSFLRKL